MLPKEIDTVVVGGGQSGIAASEHLRRNDIAHVVLERCRIVERWRTQRWDSLVANGPAWHDRFPSLKFADISSDEFASKKQIVDYFEAYAKLIDAPVLSGIDVIKVNTNDDKMGYRFKLYTPDSVIYSKNVIVATGPFQIPSVPQFWKAECCDLFNIHSSEYHKPSDLPEGAVLVVGGGSSGSQIADELQRSGRKVFLSIGKHERPPRSYRGRDLVWWFGVLGTWAETKSGLGSEHVTIAVSGSRGGFTIDFREMANRGIILLGKLKMLSCSNIKFHNDLQRNLDYGDVLFNEFLDAADAYIVNNNLNFPRDCHSRARVHDSTFITNPIYELDIIKENIKSIIWSTGFKTDYSWLEFDVFDSRGNVVHKRGVTSVPGLYFVGLPWLFNRSSSFIWGTWYDSKFIVEDILIKRKHFTYPEGYSK